MLIFAVEEVSLGYLRAAWAINPCKWCKWRAGTTLNYCVILGPSSAREFGERCPLYVGWSMNECGVQSRPRYVLPGQPGSSRAGWSRTLSLGLRKL